MVNQYLSFDSTRKLAYVLSSTMAFVSGFYTKSCNFIKHENYSASNLRFVNEEIGTFCTGSQEVLFLEVDGKKLYIPKTDGQGNIQSMLSVDRIITNVGTKRTLIQGLEWKLAGYEEMETDTKNIK